jgi:hypothetical protein
MINQRISNVAAAAIIGIAVVMSGVAHAADKVPETPAEHQQAADAYKKKAEGHRAEAAMHRSMAEMYHTQIKPVEKAKSSKPNPWLINMIKHCKGMAAKADELAAIEEKAAELHAAQAKAPATN